MKTAGLKSEVKVLTCKISYIPSFIFSISRDPKLIAIWRITMVTKPEEEPTHGVAGWAKINLFSLAVKNGTHDVIGQKP